MSTRFHRLGLALPLALAAAACSSSDATSPSNVAVVSQLQCAQAFGTWVNGGHWSTCEARMVLGYYRLGQFEQARRSLRQLLTFAERFRMDNPLVKFGSDVYQPGQPIARSTCTGPILRKSPPILSRDRSTSLGTSSIEVTTRERPGESSTTRPTISV